MQRSCEPSASFRYGMTKGPTVGYRAGLGLDESLTASSRVVSCALSLVVARDEDLGCRQFGSWTMSSSRSCDQLATACPPEL